LTEGSEWECDERKEVRARGKRSEREWKTLIRAIGSKGYRLEQVDAFVPWTGKAGV